MKLSKKDAKKISELFNSLTVSNMSAERNTDHEVVVSMMKWHDDTADQLMAEYGIDVVKFNHPETV